MFPNVTGEPVGKFESESLARYELVMVRQAQNTSVDRVGHPKPSAVLTGERAELLAGHRLPIGMKCVSQRMVVVGGFVLPEAEPLSSTSDRLGRSYVELLKRSRRAKVAAVDELERAAALAAVGEKGVASAGVVSCCRHVDGVNKGRFRMNGEQ
jgi:hypothetical protein